MRFKRSDLPGILIATVGPVVLFVGILAAFDLWDNEGYHHTPLLPNIVMPIAIGAGILGVFSRFIRAWDAVVTLAVLTVGLGVGVALLRLNGQTGALPVSMAWGSLLSFVLLNVVIVFQVLKYGLNPVLVRRDRRREAEAAAAAEQS